MKIDYARQVQLHSNLKEFLVTLKGVEDVTANMQHIMHFAIGRFHNDGILHVRKRRTIRKIGTIIKGCCITSNEVFGTQPDKLRLRMFRKLDVLSRISNRSNCMEFRDYFCNSSSGFIR